MSPEIAAKTTESASVEVPLTPLPRHWRSLQRAFVHRARSNRGKAAVYDSTGASLTYGQTFLRALALGKVLARTLGPEPYVGVLIPPSAPAAVVNTALVLWGKIPVNLNYTASPAVIDSSIQQCGITHVLTSPKVLEKVKPSRGTMVFLEDLAKQVNKADKVWAGAVSTLVPSAALGAFLPGLRGDSLDATATVIFTSGSTGDPKGVVLSHRNVLSNVAQYQQHVNLGPDEVLLGVLPYFHSFGFTVTLWGVLCLGFKGVYHVNPLDARIVGNLCHKHKATILLGTPTFMRGYVQRGEREQFATVRLPILGAEKLKPELASDIREKLGIEPLEGYGCTETGPVVSVNVPFDVVLRDGRKVPGNRPGTVGRPMPGTRVKSVDPETGADLPRGTEGMIVVAGPQVMVGYLNRPEDTAKVLKDGWYTTGDLGFVDAEGFLKITDRLSRFSKIGGEMVPHLAIEAAIQAATGVNEQCVAVTALPDAKRGERLVVLYTDLGAAPDEVCRKLQDSSLPRLWAPSAQDFFAIEAIPILGTGKVDLRGLRELAAARKTT